MHGVKLIQKALKLISIEPKYNKGNTWFEQLYDKEEPLATQVHWALKTCEKNPQKLQSQLSNTVNHYKNEHADCHPTSRCKLDPNYEPFRHVITITKAKKVLKNTIDYVLARDTSYVESFNNVMNNFQDKRIYSVTCNITTTIRAQLE